MANLNINKLYGDLQEVEAYDPPYGAELHNPRKIMLAICRDEFNFSAVTIEELEELIGIYEEEYDPRIELIQTDLEEISEILKNIQSIPPRRVSNVFV